MPAFKSLLALQYILSGLVITVRAQTSASAPASSATACSSTISPQHAAPSVAAGWRAEVVANNLESPRGIIFDDQGGLLVVEQARGISRLKFNQEPGSCVRIDGDAELIIDDPTVGQLILLTPKCRPAYVA